MKTNNSQKYSIMERRHPGERSAIDSACWCGPGRQRRALPSLAAQARTHNFQPLVYRRPCSQATICSATRSGGCCSCRWSSPRRLHRAAAGLGAIARLPRTRPGQDSGGGSAVDCLPGVVLWWSPTPRSARRWRDFNRLRFSGRSTAAAGGDDTARPRGQLVKDGGLFGESRLRLPRRRFAGSSWLRSSRS